MSRGYIRPRHWEVSSQLQEILTLPQFSEGAHRLIAKELEMVRARSSVPEKFPQPQNLCRPIIPQAKMSKCLCVMPKDLLCPPPADSPLQLPCGSSFSHMPILLSPHHSSEQTVLFLQSGTPLISSLPIQLLPAPLMDLNQLTCPTASSVRGNALGRKMAF